MRPDRQSSIARAIACGPQISLPCTAPVTSSLGPCCKPVKPMVSSAAGPALSISVVMIDVDHHAGTQAPRQLEQVVAANRHATRRPAHVRPRGMNEQRAAAAGFRNRVVVADGYDN